jgi:hypothetical protein
VKPAVDRAAWRVSALQEIDRIRIDRLRGEDRKCALGHQLDLQARGPRAQSFDQLAVGLVLHGRDEEADVLARIGLVSGRPECDVECRGQRLGVEHEGHCVGAPHVERTLVEQQRAAVRHERHHCRVCIGRLRHDTRRETGFAPSIHETTRDRGDRRADRGVGAIADREMQRLHVGGQVLFEREGHGLCHACTAAQRQLGFGECDFGARHQEQHAPAADEGQRFGDRARSRRTGPRPVGIDNEPRRRRLRGGSEPYHQCLCHRTSRGYSLPKLRRIVRTGPWSARASKLYSVNWVVPIVTHTFARK